MNHIDAVTFNVQPHITVCFKKLIFFRVNCNIYNLKIFPIGIHFQTFPSKIIINSKQLIKTKNNKMRLKSRKLHAGYSTAYEN